MKYVYLGQVVTVLLQDKKQALIQKQSGKQTQWIDIRLLEVCK